MKQEKKRNILFRADSSSLIGVGHIMRDLVLADKYDNSNIIFATQNLKGNINHKIQAYGYKVELLQDNSFKSLQRVLKKYNPHLVIIDHYQIDYQFEQKLKKLNKDLKLMVFDDTYEKHSCDILLNHNISAEEKRYKNLVPKHCEIQCGVKYTLLRDEFRVEAQKRVVFIAMGGADHSNINIKILKVLKNFRSIQVHLVTTDANQNLKELQNYVENKRWIKLHINSSKIAKLMKKSDFAIVTPSVTVNEIVYMNKPFIAIQTATNQDDISNYLLKHNYSVLKKFNKKRLSFFLNLEIKNIRIKNFTQISQLEKEIVFYFRNNDKVRQWMYSNSNKIYFLVQQKEQYIGVIDLSNIDKKLCEADIGIYSNPELKLQGDILMETLLSYSFNVLELIKVKAEVYKTNISAIKLYKRFGFKQIEEKDDILFMELKNSYLSTNKIY